MKTLPVFLTSVLLLSCLQRH